MVLSLGALFGCAAVTSDAEECFQYDVTAESYRYCGTEDSIKAQMHQAGKAMAASGAGLVDNPVAMCVTRSHVQARMHDWPEKYRRPYEDGCRASEPTPSPTPPLAGPTLWPVARVIDGDTIRVGTPGKPSESVRLIGIDTPERGHCGYEPAADYLREVIDGSRVTLTKVPGQNRDRYGRALRYVSVHGIDLGLAQIQAGFAVARYDSRDGYRPHPRQATYIAADGAAPPYVCISSPTPTLRTGGR